MKKESENNPLTIPRGKKKREKNVEPGADAYQKGVLWGSWRYTGPTPEFLKRLAEELKDRVKADDKTLTIERFLIEKEILLKTFTEWRHKSEVLQEAHDFARMVIADRRESGAIERRYDTSAAFFRMAEYSDAWKELSEWKARLRESISTPQGVTVVEIPEIPSSPMVPEKKSDK